MSTDVIIGNAAMADLLGISQVRLKQLIDAGTITKEGHGKYNLRDCVRAYTAHLRKHAAQAGRPTTGGDNSDLAAEKLRHETAKADHAELKNAALRGELVPVSDVRAEWSGIATDLRASLMAVPARVAARSGLPRDVGVKLEEELRDALEDLSDDQA